MYGFIPIAKLMLAILALLSLVFSLSLGQGALTSTDRPLTVLTTSVTLSAAPAYPPSPLLPTTWAPSSNLTKSFEPRQKSDWDACTSKGRALSCRFQTNEHPAFSPWANNDLLTRFGWNEFEEAEDEETFESMEPALQGLGLSTNVGDYELVTLSQNGPFTNSDGQRGEPSFAYYKGYYSPRQGVIINLRRKSPEAKIEERRRNFKPGDLPVPTLVPDLRRSSDVIWLQWVKLCSRGGTPQSDLRFVLNYYIVTERTKKVLKEALTRQNAGISEWPGHEFDASSDEGLAIMGTAHGSGTAFLLADHRLIIPKKIRSFVVWSLEEGYEEFLMAAKLVPI